MTDYDRLVAYLDRTKLSYVTQECVHPFERPGVWKIVSAPTNQRRLGKSFMTVMNLPSWPEVQDAARPLHVWMASGIPMFVFGILFCFAAWKTGNNTFIFLGAWFVTVIPASVILLVSLNIQRQRRNDRLKP